MREASLASTLDLGQRSAAAAANVAAVAAISKTASPLAANTLASDRQTMLISLRGIPAPSVTCGPERAADGSRQPPMSGLGEFAGNWLREAELGLVAVGG